MTYKNDTKHSFYTGPANNTVLLEPGKTIELELTSGWEDDPRWEYVKVQLDRKMLVEVNDEG